MSWLSYICFIFVLYSFLGWVLEEIYCFIVTGHFKEDGFLNGPFKPMYGFAMAIIIYILQKQLKRSNTKKILNIQIHLY